jgi:hypothetical protein
MMVSIMEVLLPYLLPFSAVLVIVAVHIHVFHCNKVYRKIKENWRDDIALQEKHLRMAGWLSVSTDTSWRKAWRWSSL